MPVYICLKLGYIVQHKIQLQKQIETLYSAIDC